MNHRGFWGGGLGWANNVLCAASCHVCKTVFLLRSAHGLVTSGRRFWHLHDAIVATLWAWSCDIFTMLLWLRSARDVFALCTWSCSVCTLCCNCLRHPRSWVGGLLINYKIWIYIYKHIYIYICIYIYILIKESFAQKLRVTDFHIITTKHNLTKIIVSSWHLLNIIINKT